MIPILIVGTMGCVDSKTEFFNGTEWKKISEWNNDKVLQYNEDGTANLVSPERYIKLKTDKMYKLSNKLNTIEHVLSPEHNIVYLNKNNKLSKIMLIDLIHKKNKNSNYNFNGKFINSFNYNGNFYIDKNILRLYIAISADGSRINKHDYKWRIRLKQEYKIRRFKKLLKLNNIPIDEKIYADGYSNFIIDYKYGLKEFPKEFYNLAPSLISIFLDEIHRWDGSINKNGIIYNTTNKNNADIVQFLFTQNGFRTSMGIDDRRGRINGKYTINSICYRLRLTTKKYGSLGSNTIINEYDNHDGYKYCFTVPSSMLVLRRNNKIFITGNSGKTCAADYLVKNFEYKKHSMAYWLKHTIMHHYGFDNISKDMTINGKSMRKIMQELGRAMRNIDIDWHIDETIKRLKQCNQEDCFVIDDVRFKNELDKLKVLEPISIKIVCDERTRLERIILRDMVIPNESEVKDVSEVEINDMVTDFTIDNDKSKTNLYENLDRIIRSELNEYWVRHYRKSD